MMAMFHLEALVMQVSVNHQVEVASPFHLLSLAYVFRLLHYPLSLLPLVPPQMAPLNLH